MPQITKKNKKNANLDKNLGKKSKKDTKQATSAKRVSASLLDTFLTDPLRNIYPRLNIPSRINPISILACGHLFAFLGGICFWLSLQNPLFALAAALFVAANHVCDVCDGEHARATGQCSNVGEFLDHFVDPLSFAYWLTGLAFSCDWHWAAPIMLFLLLALSLIVNIKAKITGVFTVSERGFGGTEFRALLIIFAISLAFMNFWNIGETMLLLATRVFIVILLIVGAVATVADIFLSVRELNACEIEPDTTAWETKK